MSLDDTLAAIDAVTGCQQCGGPLGESPSADWCSEDCQHAWFANRAGILPGEAIPEVLATMVVNAAAVAEAVAGMRAMFQRLGEACRQRQ